MSHEKERDSIEELLHELGDSPDAVAETLRAYNVKGAIGLSQSCPVANFVRREVPGAAVFTTYSHFGEHAIENPKPVREFIIGFDSGEEYQDLLAEPEVSDDT